jgi:hypothetical protein
MGWKIGRLPSPDKIAAIVKAVPGVLYLERYNALYVYPEESADVCRDFDHVKGEPFVVPTGGTHKVEIFAERGRG